jgi:hypothetical protein
MRSMTKKYEYNSAINFFSIDPTYLVEGLGAAKGAYADIRIIPLDSRTKNLDADIEALAGCSWIKRLNVERGIRFPKDRFEQLERLVNLEELSIPQIVPLDYSKFADLKTLILLEGTELGGLDKLGKLELVYLSLWNSSTLPDSAGAIKATTVRISASKKLVNIEPLCNLTHLGKLMLQDLPALHVGKEINKLVSLRDLYVEKCGWTDFSALRIDSLRKLFVSRAESLHFIKNLKNLDDLFFWDCVDGDLSPVLEHPTLSKIRFVPAKKHYTHKLEYLEKALATRKTGHA